MEGVEVDYRSREILSLKKKKNAVRKKLEKKEKKEIKIQGKGRM